MTSSDESRGPLGSLHPLAAKWLLVMALYVGESQFLGFVVPVR